MNKWPETLAAEANSLSRTWSAILDDLVITRQTLDRRYDNLESGRVKPIPGDEVFARLRAKSAARRALVDERRSISSRS